jgi:hypothetical protein
MLSGEAAQAKTYDIMVVVPNTLTPNAIYGNNQMQDCALRTNNSLCKILNWAHANYSTIESSKLRAEWARTGIFGRGTVTAGVAEWADTARCVIFAPFVGGQSAVFRTRVDSIMHTTRGGPQIPWFCILDNSSAPNGTVGNAAWFDDAATVSTRCSTGVVGINLSVSGRTLWPYLKSDPTVRWPFLSYSAPYERNPSQDPAGGIRVVVGGAQPNFINTSASQGGVNEQFPSGSHTLDDPGVNLGADSMYVWDRLWRNLDCCPGAKSQTFVSIAGLGFFNNDSTININPDATNTGIPGEYGLDLLLAGMCHFDSLTLALYGRRLLFGGMTSTRKVALTINGGLVRSLRYYGERPGIQPSDTASFYSTLDSLHKYNIPCVFGVNVDSAAAYPRDVAKLAACTPARFTPQVWTGILDTSSTRNLNYRFNDIFGRFNNRTFVGDGSGAGKDSSIASKLLQARTVTDSLWPGRVADFVIAPEDDYSPKQMRAGQSATAGKPSYSDSILYAITKARFHGLQTDGRYTDATARNNNTNPRGWFTQSGIYKSAVDSSKVKLLAHAGYQLSGGMAWGWSDRDSVAPFDSSLFGRVEIPRVICGMWDMVGVYDGDVHPNPGAAELQKTYPWRDVQYRFEDVQDPVFGYSAFAHYANCRVMRLDCSDLSGRQPDPARTGWLQIKGINDWMKACNALLGKTLVQWDYPENVLP